MTGPQFLPGLELSRRLYEDAVAPLLAEAFPDLRYAAARVGSGSEVLGVDTERSVDHEWGPRLQLFVAPEDAELAHPIRALLGDRFPKTICGWPTNFQESDDPLDPVGRMQEASGPVNHRVDVHTVPAWLERRLGLRNGRSPTTEDWLAMPQQRLAETVGGAVYRDDIDALTRARSLLTWYPQPVWRYMLACQWQRISQEEAFVGRTAEVGDELGSALTAGRLVRDLMRLTLLLARRYAPYGKWLGSAFAATPAADRLTPHLHQAASASDYASREAGLARALELLGEMQNDARLTDPIDPHARQFHGRPYLVLHAERFAHALRATIDDPVLRALPLTGSVDQWADSTDLLHQPAAIRAALRALEPRSGVP